MVDEKLSEFPLIDSIGLESIRVSVQPDIYSELVESLKETIKTKNDLIEHLKAEVERLKSSQTHTIAVPETAQPNNVHPYTNPYPFIGGPVSIMPPKPFPWYDATPSIDTTKQSGDIVSTTPLPLGSQQFTTGMVQSDGSLDLNTITNITLTPTVSPSIAEQMIKDSIENNKNYKMKTVISQSEFPY